jgi:hypothetical protein
MAKTRQRIITPIGRTAWCHVIAPREDLSHNMVWDVGLEIDEDWIKQYSAIARELVETARSADPRFPTSGLIYPWVESRGPKKDDGSPGDIIEGKWLIKAKRKTVRMRNGGQERNTAPILQDGLGQPIKPGTLDDIPPSSEVRLMLDLFAYNKAGNAGVSAGLVGVQVKKLGESDGFDALEGFGEKEEDDDLETGF